MVQPWDIQFVCSSLSLFCLALALFVFVCHSIIIREYQIFSIYFIDSISLIYKLIICAVGLTVKYCRL